MSIDEEIIRQLAAIDTLQRAIRDTFNRAYGVYPLCASLPHSLIMWVVRDGIASWRSARNKPRRYTDAEVDGGLPLD